MLGEISFNNLLVERRKQLSEENELAFTSNLAIAMDDANKTA